MDGHALSDTNIFALQQVVFFSFAIVLSVLQFTCSDYPYGNFVVDLNGNFG
jgi:hypothetical protein